jgi:hypothetical protein
MAQRWKPVIWAMRRLDSFGEIIPGAVVNVWTGRKSGGNDLVGVYTRVSGCDPVATLAVEVN